MNDNTTNNLYEMRLSVVAKSFRNQLIEPKYQDMPFEDRFGLLVDMEWCSRNENHLKQLIKSAGFFRI